ncbi:MAG: sel1 repeat family protein [Alphaproteobacteria bacterium]|nr:sel1 repeat family protein [Alphaproteobacteria bacterium]
MKRDLQLAFELARKLTQAPPQGPHAQAAEIEQTHRRGRLLVTGMLLDVLDNVSETDLARAREEMNALRAGQDFDSQAAAVLYAQALRNGKGGPADPAQARKILESEVAANRLIGAAMLAEMLAFGEGGAKDVERAIQLLARKDTRIAVNRARAALRIHMGNQARGRDPHAALAVGSDALVDLPDVIEFARLLVNHPVAGSGSLSKLILTSLLLDATADGDDAADLALADLLMSNNGAYRNATQGHTVLKALADRGNIEAQIKLVAAHVPSLDSSSRPQFQ